MSDSIGPGEFRICPSCGSRNRAAHNFCVRCSGSMDAVVTGGARSAATARPRNTRLVRFVVAGGVIAAIAVGLMIHTVFRATEDVQAITENVRADSARTIDAPAPLPPPVVTGWTPGAGLPAAPDTARHAETGGPTWSSESFPAARMNPYDVPGDPAASMVGIAPRSPRAQAAMKRQRVFTDNDLLATRGGAWSTPAPPPADADDDDSDDDD